MQYYEKDKNSTINTLLYSKRSTTAYFKKICPDGFNIVVLSASWQPVQTIAQPLLREHIHGHDDIFVREVLLRCHERNLMYAYTLFPQSTIDTHQVFMNLDTRSLGEVLYQDPDLAREYLSIKKIHPKESAYTGMQSYCVDVPEFIWTRHTKISFFKTPIFMYEVFLPDLIDPLRVHGAPACIPE